MYKSLVLVATIAALAGCNGAKDQQESAKAPSQQPPVASAPSAPASEDAHGGFVHSPSYSSSTGSSVSGDSGAQSGSSASASDAETLSPVFDHSDSATLEGPSHTGPMGGFDQQRPQQSGEALGSGDQSAGLGAGTTDSASTTSTEKQRGTVLTDTGARSIPESDAGIGAGSTSLNRSAQMDASRSTQLGSEEDLSQIPAQDDSSASTSTNSTKLSEEQGLQTNIGDEATLGETDTDRALVQRIRQAVVNDETLSSTARSVEIKSSNNQVILKGSVDSEREKAQIGSTAFRASGGKQVLNQLDVTNK
ncbi:MAG: BON domain-containing protein [Planctomycetes bacterium]|nr:BON domain-containing protein [Planctomycetota bacterium]